MKKDTTRVQYLCSKQHIAGVFFYPVQSTVLMFVSPSQRVSLPLQILGFLLVLRRERLGLAPCRRHVRVSPWAVATAVAAAGPPSEVRLCEKQVGRDVTRTPQLCWVVRMSRLGYCPWPTYLQYVLAHLGEDAVAGVRVDVSVARRVRLQRVEVGGRA